jgi:putative flippase GtrA
MSIIERAKTTAVEPAPPAGMAGSKGPLLRFIRDQRVAFVLVGSTNTVIGTGWFILFQVLLQQRFGYMVVLLCAHLAAVLCAFVLYRYLVFRVRGHLVRDLFRFELVNLTSLGVNAVTLPILVELLRWPVLFSQLVITGVTMVVSFLGHRGFSFRRTAADRAKAAAPSSSHALVRDSDPPEAGVTSPAPPVGGACDARRSTEGKAR